MKKILFIVLIFSVLSNRLYGNETSLAILPFKNSNIESKYEAFVKGIPEMLMTDLSNSKQLILVERIQIEKAFNHFQIEQTAIIDESKAIQIGQWIGAKYLLLGNFSLIGNAIRLDCRIIDAKDGVLLKATKVTGELSNVYNLIDELANNILSIFTGETIAFDKVIIDKVFEAYFTPSIVFDVYHNDKKLILYQNSEDNIEIYLGNINVYDGGRKCTYFQIYIDYRPTKVHWTELLHVEINSKIPIGYSKEIVREKYSDPAKTIPNRTKVLIKILDLKFTYDWNSASDSVQPIDYIKFYVKLERF